ncbi:hypothetical protein [Dactylosporangium sp. CS-033363]|uniref:hypothetical protein n=1 Tax=Dactylosporangium sp. CS-033363 TaxID=3239935 RepID=UPI003D8D63EB
MRPSLIAEASLPDMEHITHVGGVGWVVTEPSAPAVRILDSRLRLKALVNVPTGEQRFRVSADDRHVAVSTGEELAVVDYRGQLLWRTPWERGVAASPGCHLDSTACCGFTGHPWTSSWRSRRRPGMRSLA